MRMWDNFAVPNNHTHCILSHVANKSYQIFYLVHLKLSSIMLDIVWKLLTGGPSGQWFVFIQPNLMGTNGIISLFSNCSSQAVDYSSSV